MSLLHLSLLFLLFYPSSYQRLDDFPNNAFIDFDFDGWINVYHSLEDGNPFLSIRNEMSIHEDIILIELIKSEDNKFFVNITNGHDNVFIQNVYIDKAHIRVLAQYGVAHLYSLPDYSSAVTTTITEASGYRYSVTDCKDEWLKVSFSNETGVCVEGWMPPEYQLANPY